MRDFATFLMVIGYGFVMGSISPSEAQLAEDPTTKINMILFLIGAILFIPITIVEYKSNNGSSKNTKEEGYSDIKQIKVVSRDTRTSGIYQRKSGGFKEIM